MRVSRLCETHADRERVLDMERRIRPLRAGAFGLLGIGLLICGPWVVVVDTVSAVRGWCGLRRQRLPAGELPVP